MPINWAKQHKSLTIEFINSLHRRITLAFTQLPSVHNVFVIITKMQKQLVVLVILYCCLMETLISININYHGLHIYLLDIYCLVSSCSHLIIRKLIKSNRLFSKKASYFVNVVDWIKVWFPDRFQMQRLHPFRH